MFRPFRITIDFPALDSFVALGNRFLAYLESQEQQQISALTARVEQATKTLADSRASLAGALENQTH